MAASTVRAAIIRSRLSFIGSRKGHALSGVGFLGALRMTTPANRLGGFRFLAPFRTESFIVGNKACTRSVGTFVNFPNFHKHLLGSLRLLSNLDFVHNLALTRVRLGDAESETVLLFRIHRPGKHHGLIVGLDSHVRIRQVWFAIELVLNLLLDLSGRRVLRRWRLCIRRHLLPGCAALRECWGSCVGWLVTRGLLLCKD